MSAAKLCGYRYTWKVDMEVILVSVFRLAMPARNLQFHIIIYRTTIHPQPLSPVVTARLRCVNCSEYYDRPLGTALRTRYRGFYGERSPEIAPPNKRDAGWLKEGELLKAQTSAELN